MESGSVLTHLTLDDASSSSPPAASRFLTFKYATEAVTSKVEGRVTFTTFLVPHKVDDVCRMYNNNFKSVFGNFVPRGSESITWHRDFWFKFSAVWFWVMPPATAWDQERWDIREVPRFYPPEPELDPEEPEYEQEQRRRLEEYLQFHGFEVSERSQ